LILKNVIRLEAARAKPTKKFIAEQDCLTPDELELAPDCRLPHDLQGSQAVPLVKHKKLLSDFFDSMDRNRNGSVDFEEFSQAMIFSDGKVDCTKRNTRLKQAFYDLASAVNRNKILDELQRDEVKTVDASCSNLRKLFNINYLLNDTVYDSTVDSIHKYEAYLKESKPKEFIDMRKTEKVRCNSAVQRLLTPRELPPIEKRKAVEHQRQYQFTALASKQNNDMASLPGSTSTPSLYNKSIDHLSSRASSSRSSTRPRIPPTLSSNGRRLNSKEWNTSV